MLQHTRASGSAMLDATPPSPEEKIYSKPSQPGEDSLSLYGMPDSEMGGNPALSTPGGKLLLVTSMFMQAANIADSVMPGFVPEPVKQWIAVAMEQAPALAEQMSRQGNPMALLSAVGASPAATNPSAPPMGMAAMGMSSRGGRSAAKQEEFQ